MARMVARDIWVAGTPPDGSLSAVKLGTSTIDNDWRWKQGTWWTGFSANKPHIAKSDQKDAVFGIYLDEIGSPGTRYEGWYFDRSQNSWMAPDTSFTEYYGKPAGPSGGPAGMGSPLSQPPGLDSMGSVSTPTTIQAVEFSVIDGGFWVAKNAQASAANVPENPHRGFSIINEGDWEKYSGGASVSDAFSLDTYKEMGWGGLNKPFLAYQSGNVVQPAGEELASAMDAYMQNGDRGALRALRAVGVKPPEGGKFEKGGSLLDKVAELF